MLLFDLCTKICNQIIFYKFYNLNIKFNYGFRLPVKSGKPQNPDFRGSLRNPETIKLT